MRTLIDSGARLTFGSDWPVTSEIPLAGMPVPVHRQTPDRKPVGGWIPEEKIRIDEAMAAYTSNVSYQAFGDEEWGTLEIGKDATFIILNGNPLDIDAFDISALEIQATYRKGKLLYSK